MNRPLTTWLLFAVFLALAAGGLGWLTRQTLELDRAEALARGQAEQEERIGLALWRMDAFLMPLLVQEASRPEFLYQPNYVLTSTKGAKAITEKTLSPLVASQPEFVKLHFELAADGRLTSPQAPQGDDRTWSLGNGANAEGIHAAENRMDELRRQLSYAQLIEQLPPANSVAMVPGPPPGSGELALNNSNPVVESFAQQSLAVQQETQLPTTNAPAPRGRAFGNNEIAQADVPPVQQGTNDSSGNLLNRRGQSQQRNPNADLSSRNNVYQAYAQRAATDNFNNSASVAIATPAVEGVSSPFWIGPELFLARRVERGGKALIQGCWLDWPQLRERLTSEVADILPQVDFHPASPGDTRALAHVLATLPVQISAPQESEPFSLWSPIRLALALAWIGLLAAAAAAAVTLHSILALSERRAAFVAAVTHELRTPLTTFRMYAEMLASGMVPAERQPTYLETLRVEADRLAHLVDNVLQYARLERGRKAAPRETISVAALTERITSRLAARAQEAELQLSVDVAISAIKEQVTTDVAALEQILFNLVDNACKYASQGPDKRLHLEVTGENKRVLWCVRDHGTGIPQENYRRLFQPFSKSVHEAAHSAPGVGLGLALSRRLAQELGGELRLADSGKAGTSFTLALPKAPTVA